MVLNKILISSGLIIGLVLIFKNINKKEKINKIDKTTSMSNLKNNNKNNSQTQTIVTLDKDDTFLIKETYSENNTKWYDIIEEVKH